MRSEALRGLLAIGLLAALTPASAQITFIPGPQFQVPNGPAFVADGDFNHDGIEDAAVAVTSAGKVAALLASNTGQFQSATTVAVGSSLRGVATADFNGDGKVDIAAIDIALKRLFVLSGEGNGTFGAPQPFQVGNQGPIALAVGNFDNGNGPDVVTANGTAGTITTFLNQGGDNGLLAPPNISLGAGSNPHAIGTADFSSDGFDDIVVLVSGSGGPDNVAYLQNNGVGSFQSVTPVNFPVGAGTKALTISDFNGDGIPDVAVLNGAAVQPNTFTISVLLDQTSTTSTGHVVGTGEFQSLGALPITCPAAINGIPVNCTPQDIVAADFDGDGFVDLAVSFSTTPIDAAPATAGLVSAYAGRGDGSFELATQVLVGIAPRQIAAADFTGDGVPDLVVTESTSNAVRILRSLPHFDRPLGAACETPSLCTSTFCVDGVCCLSSACPAGERCNLEGQEGSCSAVPTQTPAATHTPSPAVTPGTPTRTPVPPGGACAVSGQCAFGFFCNTAENVCCSLSECPAGQSCRVAGHEGFCSSLPTPTPSPRQLGDFCIPNDPTACASGFCTDNVCCDAQTCAQPMRCDIGGGEGSCSLPLPRGKACNKNSDCADPLICLFDADVGVTVCTAFAPTPTFIPIGSPTPVPSPTVLSCLGDCNLDDGVETTELLSMVVDALYERSAPLCEDANGDGLVSVDEVLKAANNAGAICQVVNVCGCSCQCQGCSFQSASLCLSAGDCTCDELCGAGCTNNAACGSFAGANDISCH